MGPSKRKFDIDPQWRYAVETKSFKRDTKVSNSIHDPVELATIETGRRMRLGMTESSRTRVLVLDTSALVMGLNPSGLDLSTYSTASVLDELIPDSLPYTRFCTSRDSGRLILRKPTGSSMRAVEDASSKVGDIGVLSNADLEVLATAVDLGGVGLSPVIISDDYAIQNVAETLGLEHASLANFGIKGKFDWMYYCPACFRRYRIEDAEQACRVCGTHLKRKATRKAKVARKVTGGLNARTESFRQD